MPIPLFTLVAFLGLAVTPADEADVAHPIPEANIVVAPTTSHTSIKSLRVQEPACLPRDAI